YWLSRIIPEQHALLTQSRSDACHWPRQRVTTWRFGSRVLGRFCGTEGWFRDKGPGLPSIPFGRDAKFGPERAVEVREVSEPRVAVPATWMASTSHATSPDATTPAAARATSADNSRTAGSRDTRKRRWPRVAPASAANPSNQSGAYRKATQRSPAACSCPHSKHWPAFPSRNDPGVIRSRPSGVRYWKLPTTTTPIETCACRSSNGRAAGASVHITTSSDQPSPLATSWPAVRPGAPLVARRANA